MRKRGPADRKSAFPFRKHRPLANPFFRFGASPEKGMPYFEPGGKPSFRARLSRTRFFGETRSPEGRPWRFRNAGIAARMAIGRCCAWRHGLPEYSHPRLWAEDRRMTVGQETNPCESLFRQTSHAWPGRSLYTFRALRTDAARVTAQAAIPPHSGFSGRRRMGTGLPGPHNHV